MILHSKSNTVVSEIFTERNLHEFHEKAWICKNSLAKFNVGMYKMAAVYVCSIRQRGNKGRLSIVHYLFLIDNNP